MSMGLIFEHWPNCKLYFSFCHSHRDMLASKRHCEFIFGFSRICAFLSSLFWQRQQQRYYSFRICSSIFFSPVFQTESFTSSCFSVFCSSLVLDMLSTILIWRSECYLSMSFWIQIN